MSWRERVREPLRTMEPYRSAGSQAAIRLDANESPLALPESARETLARTLAETKLNRYPDLMALELRAAVAAQLRVKPEQLLFGNGSDELIGLLCETFARPGKSQPQGRVLYPTPTFV